MKVFISWSGDRSRQLAQALHEWLPLVLHYIEPWLSEADIAAGERWAQEVAQELEASNFGVLCVTPENLHAPWVLFEAGALAKSMQTARVIPLLFNLEFSDIAGPLAQFQAKKVERAAIQDIVNSINSSVDLGVPADRARQLFDALWPELEKKIAAIPSAAPSKKHARPQHEILEELVASIRGLNARFRDLEELVNSSSLRSPRSRMRHFHPAMFDEFLHLIGQSPDDSIGLVFLGSLVRDDYPWLYEVILDAHRTIQTHGRDSIEALKALSTLRRTSHALERMPMARSKEAHIIAMEFPRLLDMYLHRCGPSSTESVELDAKAPSGRDADG